VGRSFQIERRLKLAAASLSATSSTAAGSTSATASTAASSSAASGSAWTTRITVNFRSHYKVLSQHATPGFFIVTSHVLQSYVDWTSLIDFDEELARIRISLLVYFWAFDQLAVHFNLNRT
jgi:hypothetical protein